MQREGKKVVQSVRPQSVKGAFHCPLMVLRSLTRGQDNKAGRGSDPRRMRKEEVQWEKPLKWTKWTGLIL